MPRAKKVAGRAKLTHAAVARMRTGETLVDGDMPAGSGVMEVRRRRLAGGATDTAFAFRWRVGGTDRSFVFARYQEKKAGVPDSLDAARAEARKFAQCVAEGRDPREARANEIEAVRREEKARRERGSLAQLLNAYTAHLKARGAMSARQVANQFTKHVIDAHPHIAATAAADIRPDDVREILAKMERAGIERQCNSVRASLSAAFRWAAKARNEWRSANSGTMIVVSGNPVSVVPVAVEFNRARDRILTDAELKAFIGLTRDYSTPRKGKERILHGRVEVALTHQARLLLGGPRARQLLRATWAHYTERVDDDGTVERVLALSDGKGKGPAREVLIPVSETVSGVIERLRQFNGPGKFIFSTDSGKTPISEHTLSESATHIAKRICGATGNHFVASDVRRTAETRMRALGISKELRAELLSHGRQTDVQSRHYDRAHDLAAKADALALWEDHLGQVVAGKAGGSVLRGRFGLKRHKLVPPARNLDGKMNVVATARAAVSRIR